MATRTDISVFFTLSPRLIVIDAPSDSLTIQDLHDTLSSIDDDIDNMMYPNLIATAGKEDLGGDVSVGLTATLQNAQVMFERRMVDLESGTVTTTDAGPTTTLLLIDSNAHFIDNGVARDDIIMNHTDMSHSEVLEVISNTELLVLTPTGGATNDFTFGDNYIVYLMVQCEITGGNLVAIGPGGSGGGDVTIAAIFPTFGTQVVRTSSASATIATLEIDELKLRIESLRDGHARFGSTIYWDPVAGDDAFIGNSAVTPVLTFARAHDLAAQDDVIYGLTQSSAAAVEVDEIISITKSGISLRGPGDSFVFKPTGGGTGGATITIAADGVEVSGIAVDHSADPTATDGIIISGNGNAIEKCSFIDMGADAIHTENADAIEIRDINVSEPGDDGIHVGDNTTNLTIRGLKCFEPIGHGVDIDGLAVENVIVEDSIIYDCGGYGLRAGPGSTHTIIRENVSFFDNTLGKIFDDGATELYIELSSDDYLAFAGSVHIDVAGGVAGTIFPVGTRANPVNNITDARTIADVQSIQAYTVHGPITLNAAHDSWIFNGANQLADIITLNNQSVDGSSFYKVQLTGQQNGTITATNVHLNGVTDIDGTYSQCGLMAAGFSVKAGATPTIAHSYSEVAGNNTPIADLTAGSDASLNMRSYSGGIEVRNLDNANSRMSLELVAGNPKLAVSCTAGLISIRGVGRPITDNSAGTTIDRKGYVVGEVVDILRFKQITSQVTAKMEVYGDDGNILVEGDIFEDAAGVIPYKGQGIERRESLE